MKKHLIFLLVAGLFAFTSCSSDDDGSTSENTVVGTWKLESTNPTIPGLDPEECPSRPEITFNANETADWTFYSEETCEATTDSGTWSKNSATEYSITIPDYGTFEGTVAFQSAQQFTFSTDYQGFPVQLTFVK